MENSIKRKLIVENPTYELEFDVVQENRDSDKRYYIKGEYIMMNRQNKNKRFYDEMDMLPAIDVFTEQYIKTGRAGGELNHSTSPDMDLGRLADKIISLERDKSNPDYFIGKSLVLSTPSGRILECLIRDGLKFGKSTKCLGQIIEESSGNRVKHPIILGVDNVYDPSVSTAFVNGIYESKEYIISDDGKIAEAYQALEKHLSKYPNRHSDAIRQHILEGLQKFLTQI